VPPLVDGGGKDHEIDPERTWFMATATAIPAPRLIGTDGLSALFGALVANGYHVIGPAVQDAATVRRTRSAVEGAADRMGRQLDACGLRELMAGSHGAARWDDVAARCRD
jgi:hypothetical protein